MDISNTSNMSNNDIMKYCVLFVIFILLILLVCLLCSNNDSTNNRYDNYAFRQPISINEQTYQKMLDAVTHYSLKSDNYNEKLVLIYLSTFHLFDMNYEYTDVKILDDKLKNYPAFTNHKEFPTGSMHNNIQKAIITHITKNIDWSERKLTSDQEKDRQILDVYLKDLFKNIGVSKKLEQPDLNLTALNK